MKVKIGDKIYDANNIPIMVILTPADKQNIANMPEDKTKYCACPDSYSPLDIIHWMREVPNESS